MVALRLSKASEPFAFAGLDLEAFFWVGFKSLELEPFGALELFKAFSNNVPLGGFLRVLMVLIYGGVLPT
jgi:hypothetical protein